MVPYAGVCHESRTKEKNIEDVASFVYAEARVFSSQCLDPARKKHLNQIETNSKYMQIRLIFVGFVIFQCLPVCFSDFGERK